MISDKAFILAAGFGKRLRPLTLSRPKPMVTVHDKPMIDYAIEHFQTYGVQDFVVNTHHLPDILQNHLRQTYGSHVTILHEPEILETGGGLKNGLSLFDGQDFFVVNGDTIWADEPDKTALCRMADAWDPNKMDILMLLQPVSRMTVTHGVGDYDLDDQGRATRSHDQTGEYMFTSVRLNRSSIFEGTPDGAFSYLQLMDKAEREGRLFGLIHDGQWFHISTPQDLEDTEKSGFLLAKNGQDKDRPYQE